MLEIEISILDDVQGVEYEFADGTDLPFDDAAFDAVVCQFGVMLFLDRAKGLAESFRVLKPDGCFLFSFWDALEKSQNKSPVVSDGQSYANLLYRDALFQQVCSFERR